MKTKIFKTVFPMLAFIIAIAGAFAFTTTPDTKAGAQFIGHLKVGNECEETGVMCQDVFNNKPCVSGGSNLYKLEGTSCPNQLWRIN